MLSIITSEGFISIILEMTSTVWIPSGLAFFMVAILLDKFVLSACADWKESCEKVGAGEEKREKAYSEAEDAATPTQNRVTQVTPKERTGRLNSYRAFSLSLFLKKFP